MYLKNKNKNKSRALESTANQMVDFRIRPLSYILCIWGLIAFWPYMSFCSDLSHILCVWGLMPSGHT